MASIVVSGDTSGTVTLSAPAVAGTTTLTLPTTTSTLAINGPAFSAYKNSGSQSITTSTFTKLTFDTELFDTNNNFASSTFTPTVAGYYQVNAGVSTSGTTSQTRAILMLYKNASAIYALQDLTITSFRYSGSATVYMNGTTDTLEVYAYIVGTSPIAESGLGGTGYNTWFNGSMIRSA
jgi:hypothetical protein